MGKVITTGSSNLTELDFAINFDLSDLSTPPTMTLTNLSVGAGQANMTWWYEWKSPSGNIIHAGGFGTPDMVGAWAAENSYTSGVVWPQPNQHVEWGMYTVTLFTRTTNNSEPGIYKNTKTVMLCAPHGNKNSKNNYGVSTIGKQVMCKDNVIVVNDNSLYVYQGANGVQWNNTYPKWMLDYPPVMDDTLYQPATVTAEGVMSAIFPALINGSNHVVDYSTIIKYQVDYDYSVYFKYKKRIVFDVFCNINISGLMCEYNAYLKEYHACNGSTNTQKALKHHLLNDKMMVLMMAAQTGETCCGTDMHTLVNEIIQLGGFSCSCTSGEGQGVGSTINPNVFKLLPCFEALNIQTDQPLGTLPGMIEALQQFACDTASNGGGGGTVTGTPRVIPAYHPSGNGFQDSQLVQRNIGDLGILDAQAREVVVGGSIYMNGSNRYRYSKYNTHQAGPNGLEDTLLEYNGPGFIKYFKMGTIYDAVNDQFSFQFKWNQYVKEILFSTDNGINAPFIFNNRIKTADPNGANSAGHWLLGKYVNLGGPSGPVSDQSYIVVNVEGVPYKIYATPL
jgi:hypothetical protein